MAKYQKNALIEIVSRTEKDVLVHNEGQPADQWTIPADVFERTYEEVVNDFGWAIKQLKAGRRVAREEWNGKRMFIYYEHAIVTTARSGSIRDVYANDLVPYGAYIAMKTAQDNVVPWLASQADVLATDWVLV